MSASGKNLTRSLQRHLASHHSAQAEPQQVPVPKTAQDYIDDSRLKHFAASDDGNIRCTKCERTVATELGKNTSRALQSHVCAKGGRARELQERFRDRFESRNDRSIWCKACQKQIVGPRQDHVERALDAHVKGNCREADSSVPYPHPTVVTPPPAATAISPQPQPTEPVYPNTPL